MINFKLSEKLLVKEQLKKLVTLINKTSTLINKQLEKLVILINETDALINEQMEIIVSWLM